MSPIISRIRSHLAAPESDHRKIVTGLFWVSLFVFVGKLAGAAKEMSIAWRYGVSETVDAYIFILNLVSWPVSVWFGVLTVVLVPLVARVRIDSPSELPRFRGELLGLTLIIGVGLGFFAWFGLPDLLRADWLGLSDRALAEALHMSGGLALLAPMGTVISLFSAWMLACGRHRNTLFEAIPALTILAALFLPPGWVPEPLLWGTVAGFALHMTALATPLRQLGELQMPSIDFTSPEWRGFWNSIGIMAIGQVLMSFTSIIDQFFAVQLGHGALSSLGYSNRILALILGMSAMAIGRATLPVFSRKQTESFTNVYALAIQWAKWIFFAASTMVVVLWIIAPFIVEILFERGKFKSSDSIAVTELTRYGLLQLPFYMVGMLAVSVLSSKKEYTTIAWIAALNLATKIISSYFFVPLFGLPGILISTTVMHLISMSLCLLAMSKSSKGNLR